VDHILTNTRAWVSGLAGLVLVGTSVHEWLYHEHHKYASGPSIVIAIGCAAGAVVAFVVMNIAVDVADREKEIHQLAQYVDDRIAQRDKAAGDI